VNEPENNSAPRVLMATTSFPRWPDEPDGWFVEDLTSELTKRMARVVVLAPGDPNALRRETRGEISIWRPTYLWPRRLQQLAYGPGIPWNLANRLGAKLGLPFFLLRFFAAIARSGRQVDVIHAHWGVVGAMAVAARRLHKRPVVLTVHGSDMRTDSRLIAALTRYAVRHADQVTTLSNEFLEKIRAIPGARPERCHFLPNGTHLPALEQSTHSRRFDATRSDFPRLITVGVQIPKRNYDHLIRAAIAIREDHPSLSLTLVGDGPEHERLKKIVSDRGASDFIRFTGQLPPGSVGKKLLEADLYVSPTTIENFGTAVVEAAAHGLPIVTTRVGFPAELVDPSGGAIIDPNDESHLTSAIRQILSHADTLATMGQHMRHRVEDLGLTWSGIGEQMMILYEKARSEPRH
jgi:glycosyltransferase involved in cell wall biosynthesis